MAIFTALLDNRFLFIEWAIHMDEPIINNDSKLHNETHSQQESIQASSVKARSDKLDHHITGTLQRLIAIRYRFAKQYLSIASGFCHQSIQLSHFCQTDVGR